jgi:adenosylmethionine-8-amino-7-oxononanoate aminotransferase
MAARYVEQEIENQGPETVAAVIGEPISTAAGVHVPGKIYWEMLREICDKHGVLLIADEVINGFGRTGTLFAIEQYGIVPDIMTMAKGLSSGYAPIAATVVRDSVYEVFKEQPNVPMGHLLTFGGHPVAAAAAVKNLEIFDDEKLVERGAQTGKRLGEKLEELRSHPTIGDVRGVGMLWGIELVSSKEKKAKFGKDHGFTKRLNELFMEHGIVTRAWDVIHFAPPLVATDADIDHIVATVDECLSIAEKEFAADITA